MDNELVKRLVEKHKSMVEQFIPDLMDSTDHNEYNATIEQVNSLRDATADCATDRIYDEERHSGIENRGEFREAGKQIAEYFFGK